MAHILSFLEHTWFLLQSSKSLHKTSLPALLDTLNEVIVVEQLCNALSSLIKLTIKCKNTNTEENLSFTEQNTIDVLGIGMCIACFYPKTTRIPVFHFFVCLFCFLFKVWPEPIYLKSFLVEHHVCAIFDITTTTKNPNNKNNTQTQTPKPHTYKTTCALGTFCGSFKHGSLSHSHFQIIHWDAKVT